MQTLFSARTAEPKPPGPEVLVSVTVTCCDEEPFLRECLWSVAAQSHGCLELIIVDDSSSDQSANIAQDWLRGNHGRFDRAVLIQHARREGLSQALDTAFTAALASYVFVLPANKGIFPRAIARLLESIEDTNTGATYSQIEIFGEATGLGRADIWDPEVLRLNDYIGPMALVSKAAWARVGGYTSGGGWDGSGLWRKFIENGIDGMFVPEILCRSRACRPIAPDR